MRPFRASPRPPSPLAHNDAAQGPCSFSAQDCQQCSRAMRNQSLVPVGGVGSMSKEKYAHLTHAHQDLHGGWADQQYRWPTKPNRTIGSRLPERLLRQEFVQLAHGASTQCLGKPHHDRKGSEVFAHCAAPLRCQSELHCSGMLACPIPTVVGESQQENLACGYVNLHVFDAEMTQSSNASKLDPLIVRGDDQRCGWKQKQNRPKQQAKRREREGKTTKKRIQHARELLTPQASGHQPPASQPPFSRQRALQTERAGRGEGKPGQERDEKLQLPAPRPLFYPSGLYKQTGKTQPKLPTQGVEIQPRRSSPTIPQQQAHKTAGIRVHLAWPRSSKGAWLKPGHTTRSHGWTKTPQHLATNVAERLRPGANPIC